MPIRIRLIISYIAMLLVPLILLPLAALAIGAAYLGDMEDFYPIALNHHSLQQAVEENILVFEELQQTASQQPQKLLDNSYLQDLDKRLESTRSGLVLRKNNDLLYISPLLEQAKITASLPPFGYYRGPDQHRGKTPEDHRWNIRQFDFYFADQSPGTVFAITDIGPIGGFLEKYFRVLFPTALIILAITCALLTFWVSRSITRPIHRLKEAAGQIKEGNLNFTIKAESADELGQLSNAFEEMRSHLQDSIAAQLQYEENRKELIANISHDLRTPVTAIKGYTEGILDGVADTPEKMKKYIKTIHNKTLDIEHLIEELFLYSKLDLGKEAFNFETVDLVEYLAHIAEELQLDLDKQNAVLHLEPLQADEPLTVMLDREKIKRVIANVVDNSVKYMDHPGLITIGIIPGGEEIGIRITDNGPGISPRDLPFIFERFYRADQSRNTSTGGTGLGLAIARRIVEEHGGRIGADSPEGAGTSITFTLRRTGG